MSQFLFIITNIIMPLFFIIGLGAIIQKKFTLHIPSLSKIQIYVFVPALVFQKIYTSSLSSGLIFKVAFYTFAIFLILMGLATLITKTFRFEKGKEKAFINATVLRNTGNYGIPLITLLYAGSSNDYAVSIHMIVVITSTVLMYTVGLYNASSGKYSGKAALKNIKGIPTIYMILIAGGLKVLNVELPDSALAPVIFLAQGVVPVSLFALGCQLAESKFAIGDMSVYIANFMRLVVGPLVAYGLCLIMQMDAITTQVLVIGSGTPTAVNSLFLAIEFGGDAEYASETIFISTILSAFTISILIYLIV